MSKSLNWFIREDGKVAIALPHKQCCKISMYGVRLVSKELNPIAYPRDEKKGSIEIVRSKCRTFDEAKRACEYFDSTGTTIESMEEVSSV